MPPPSLYGPGGEGVLELIWRLRHLDGYDILPLGAHFRARGGDDGHGPSIARAKLVARENDVVAEWAAASEDARTALSLNAASRGAGVAAFGPYLSEVAGVIAIRHLLSPELFEAVAGTWLDLAQPWGHVAERMSALLGRIAAITESEAEALAATGTPPNPRLMWVEAHFADREFMFNSAVLTGSWRAWRAAAMATSRADGAFSEADYSSAWSITATIAGVTVLALAFEPLLGAEKLAQLGIPWRSVVGGF
jgi:hypothetical protein